MTPSSAEPIPPRRTAGLGGESVAPAVEEGPLVPRRPPWRHVPVGGAPQVVYEEGTLRAGPGPIHLRRCRRRGEFSTVHSPYCHHYLLSRSGSRNSRREERP